jgi:hypothetical protein
VIRRWCRGTSWVALCVVVLLAGLFTAGPSSGATLAGGISTTDGTSIAVVPMGHLGDPANKFFETFTAGPAGSWVLTTPTGVATNGGIVVASPGANAAAVLPWYLLRFTAVRPLDSGHAAGAGEVLPPLAVSPTSLSVASDGSVAFVTRRGAVMVGPSLAGPFTTLISVTALRRTSAGRRCAIVGLTSVVAVVGGRDVVGATCARPGSDGIFRRDSSGWHTGSTRATAPVSVVRLDAGPSGSTFGLVSVAGARPFLAAGRVTDGGFQLGGVVRQRSSSLRSTALVAAAPGAQPSYIIAAVGTRGVSAARLPVAGVAATLGPVLPRDVQAVVMGSASPASGGAARVTAFSVEGSLLKELTLAPAGTRWVVAATQHIAVPYGSSQ